jgi:eukaryotic-like serine/threonine-protein kinase
VTAERWQQIERLYHATLEREPGQRGSYLAQACGVDQALRREVEGLLAQQDEAGSFMPPGIPGWSVRWL